MPFKVRCRLAAFLGDPEKFPCAFGYQIGDEFIWDGERVIGRVCPHFLSSAFPIITGVYITGNKYCERYFPRYAIRAPEGQDMENIARLKAGLAKQTERGRAWTASCPCPLTVGFFVIEPMGVIETGTNYQRQKRIVEKLKEEPGLTAEEILNKFFSKEERQALPLIHRTLVEIMMEELAEAGSIELREGKAYPKSPSLKGQL